MSKQWKPEIKIIGLGAGNLEQMSLGTYRRLREGRGPLYARTSHHPVIVELQDEGIEFEFFDSVYEAHERFQPVYEEIAEAIIVAATASQDPLRYVVPGHPLVAEQTVQLLFAAEAEGRARITVVGGGSFLDPVFTALRIDPNDGFQLQDATMLNARDWSLKQHLMVSQLYDAFTASEVKLTLMELLPDDYEVTLVTAAGSSEEAIESFPLYELDHNMKVSNLTVLYVPPVPDESYRVHTFSHLQEVIRTLRGPDGCPWDRKQTHFTLKHYLLEETYEVLEAIDEEDDEHLVEELGDVLLQVLLHAQIGEDEGYFAIEDVIGSLTEKMIRRHPYVFNKKMEGESAIEVEERWDKIKELENRDRETPASLLEDIPRTMPALMTAYEVQKKVAKVGFQWQEEAPRWEKLEEEIAEWKDALTGNSKEEAKKEFGDVLFILINLAQTYKIHPEEALLMTNRKFIQRFQYIEQRLADSGKTLEETDLLEMDGYWDEAKNRE
ncbi:tetrapyrrole methylase family protein/MazG family protein [Geomicrobium halophilum]|uniref:Tetrapyrrole methylase family protein/MazG family protein n=1 Tax=Geomicrobium halophilum TaxID=549000 RepID=A0A841PRK4_9BACL|nr:nucleoside triphosphate pyrophosphohydrolase [Geomicrobium halophilum]MBB6451547.1 tetrapyrrole methylase family protein/MazG family protein [Geomicrobium halophilum]